ncbi:MAG: class I SAM-dependent methyltransferase [Cyanobacteria bacterium J06621_8]
MATGQDTLWDKFLQPLFGFLINSQELKELADSIDWETESNLLKNHSLLYPKYYSSQNFHGIPGGYLNAGAAVTYDPVTKHALPPNENWNRESVIKAIAGNPRKILDLGCGTGSTTMLLKQAFPQATVIGLDLSPHMLVMSQYKAQQAGLNIQWVHGLAEATGFAADEFDVVTASLLLHETPAKISEAVLMEAYRILKPAGQIIILDGHQQTLRNTIWLTEIFEEPYIKEYAAGSVDAWLGRAKFSQVMTKDVWWTNQLTTGVKSIN